MCIRDRDNPFTACAPSSISVLAEAENTKRCGSNTGANSVSRFVIIPDNIIADTIELVIPHLWNPVAT